MLNDAGDRRERGGERLRCVDAAEMRIENEVAPVGREWPAVCGASEAKVAAAAVSIEGARDCAPGRLEPERDDLDWQRKAAEPLDALRTVGDHDHAPARGGDDLFPQKRAAAALDDAQRTVDLIGAVDGQIEFGRFVQRSEPNALAFRLAPRRLGSRDADDVKPAPHPLAHSHDEMRGRGAGSEAEPHAVRDKRRRALGGNAFQALGVHRSRPASSMYLSSVYSSMPWREPSRPM